MPRPDRPPGQDPRLPDRAGRDRGGAGEAPGGPAGGGRGAGGHAGGPAAGGLSRRRRARRSASCASWLRRALPEYMVPAAYHVLDALPLTPNGKVDRGALPAPEPVGDGSARVPWCRRAARSRKQSLRSGRRSSASRRLGSASTTSFFDLGGHSLLAAQLVSRLRDLFGVELPLRTLFEDPTVAGVARWIEEGRRAGHGLELPPLLAGRASCGDPAVVRAAVALVPRPVGARPGDVQHAGRRCASPGPLDLAAFERSLAEIVRRHEVLRTTFASVDGRPVQVVAESDRAAAGRGRSPCARGAAARGGGAAAGDRGGAAAVRPGPGSAGPRAARAARRRRPCDPADDAPHHRRRLVVRRRGGRAGDALRRVPPRCPLALARAADPVRRLRALAAGLAAGGAAGSAGRLLVGAARGSDAAGAADRPAPPADPDDPRGDPDVHDPGHGVGAARRASAATRG